MINREIAPYRESDKAETPLSCLTIAEDFGRAFVQSALIAPVWNGLGQLVTGGHLPHVSIVNEKNAESNVADSWAQKFGGAIGMAADFHFLGKLKLGPFRHVETANTLSLVQRCGQHFMRSAKQGAVYGAIFTGSDPSNNMLYGRVANAGSQALTFGLLGGGSESLSGIKTLAKIKLGTLSNALSDMSIAGVVGLPAGAVGAVADAKFNGHKVTLEDIKQAAVDYGIIGCTLAGINHGAAALNGARLAKESMQSPVLKNCDLQAVPKIVEEPTTPGVIVDGIRRIPVEENAAAVTSSGEANSSDTTQARHEQIHSVAEVDPARPRYLQELEDCLSNGRTGDAKEILEMGLLDADGIRSAAGRGLETCLSNGWGGDAKKIFEMGLLGEAELRADGIRSAAGRGLETCLSNGRAGDAKKILEMGLLGEAELRADGIRSAAGRGLETCLFDGRTGDAKEILEMGLLDADGIRSVAGRGLEDCLSNSRPEGAKEILEMGLLGEAELRADGIRSAAGRGLETCLSKGWGGEAKKFLKMGLLDADGIRSAAGKGLQNCLSDGRTGDAKKILEMGLLDADGIRSVAGRGLQNCLSDGRTGDAKKILEMGLLGEAELRADGIRSAAERGLETHLSKGFVRDAKKILEMGLLDQSAIDRIFVQLVQAGHITSVVRSGLDIGKDFSVIAKEYLGTLKLTNEAASELFERMKMADPAWRGGNPDVGLFEKGAQIFGAARMLRYVFKRNVSPHEVLDGFGDVVKMLRGSGLNAEDFYNNVLMQVNRDSAVDDIGDSCARLKAIAGDYRDNFDEVMEKAKHYPDIATVQDLMVRFPDKTSIFSSWAKLQQYSKLEHFIGRSELLPGIQELRLAGHLKRAKWLEELAFHPDSRVGKELIEDFLLKEDPTEFLERGDGHSSELHELLKPSNYLEIPHLDLRAEELREALIDGSLDRLQVFTPMKVEYEVGGVDLASELKRALGSRQTGQRGEAQNPKKLFSEVSKVLMQDILSIAKVLQGAEMSQESAVKISGLLYNKEIGLTRPPGSFKLVAEIHKKSDPLAVVAGDDTASCMQFGSGKNNVYMFNPNDALFTIRLERPDGTQRTIAQSVLTKDVDVRELVPTIVKKMKGRESAINIFPEEGMRNGKAVIAADNVEVHPNYMTDVYKSALEGVYRDFFGRYVELYGEKENLGSDKVVVGLGYGDALESLPKEENTYLPQAPVAYSDKVHEQVSRLSLIAPPTSTVKASIPKQLVRTMMPNNKAQAITELTFEDALPLSYVESKMYKEVPTLSQGLYDLENTLIAKDINNIAKGRQNLSFKYTDTAGKMRGYLLAYEGKVEMEGSEKPAIYIEDFASDSYLEAKAGESGDVGGKLLLKFAKAYKQNYLDKGNMMPIYMNARSATSYALLMKHIESLGRKYGYKFEMTEVDTRQVGSTTMHDVMITPEPVKEVNHVNRQLAKTSL